MSGTTKPTRISLDGADAAPVINFDGVPVFSFFGDKGRLTLEALVVDEDVDGKAFHRRVVVAHLQATTVGLQALRGALDGIDEIRSPDRPPSDQKPN